MYIIQRFQPEEKESSNVFSNVRVIALPLCVLSCLCFDSL
jgi:hypothetical protein